MVEYCPLCDRELGSSVSKHHLIPRSKKGKETVKLHKICHNQIHSLFDDRELEKNYSTIALLRANDDIQKFIKWISKKPIDYFDKSIMSKKHAWKKHK